MSVRVSSLTQATQDIQGKCGSSVRIDRRPTAFSLAALPGHQWQDRWQLRASIWTGMRRAPLLPRRARPCWRCSTEPATPRRSITKAALCAPRSRRAARYCRPLRRRARVGDPDQRGHRGRQSGPHPAVFAWAHAASHRPALCFRPSSIPPCGKAAGLRRRMSSAFRSMAMACWTWLHSTLRCRATIAHPACPWWRSCWPTTRPAFFSPSRRSRRV